MQTAAITSQRRISSLHFLLLSATVLTIYSQAFLGEFIYDDHFQLVSNPYTKDFGTLKVLFTQNVWNFSSSMQSVYYRPLHMLTYLLIYKTFGLTPFAYHLTNILLHLTVVLILWRIARRYVGRDESLLAALFFALHPVQVEPVAWIAGTPDLLYSAFLLTSYWLYLKGHLNLSLLPFAAALFSKEPAVLFPALIAADQALFRRLEKRKFQWWMIAAFLLIVSYFILRINAIGPLWKLGNNVTAGPVEQAISGLTFAGLYIGKLVFPSELNVYYDYRLPLSGWTIAWGLFILILAFAACYRFRTNRIFLFGMLWFFIFLAPALVVKAVSASLFADRYLYLSSAGFFLAFLSFSLNRLIKIAAVALIAVFGLAAYNYTHIWNNDLSLWSDAASKSPRIPTVNYNLATALMKQRKWEQASYWFNRTVELEPGMAQAYYSLALCRYQLGDRVGAERNLRAFVKYWKGDERMRDQALSRLKEVQSSP